MDLKKGYKRKLLALGKRGRPAVKIWFPKYFIPVLLLFFVFLSHPGCKVPRIPEQAEIKYDIQGQWEITSIVAGKTKLKRVCIFVGTKKSGTVEPVDGESGTYNVGGEFGTAVEFFFLTYDTDGQKVYESYRGNFIDDTYMDGTGAYTRQDQRYGNSLAWGAYRVIQ